MTWKQDLEAIQSKQESLTREQIEALTQSTENKLQELERQVEEKADLAKKTERQLNAAKLLARQAKKEKEALQNRVTKLQESSQARQQ